VNLEEAKRICPDFDPFRRPEDGMIACRHKVGERLCRRENHFDCELVRYSKRPQKSVSQTRVETWQRCQRLFGYRYAWKVPRPEEPSWAVLGSAFALCRAKIDHGMAWSVPITLPAQDRMRLQAILEYYASMPAFPGTCEVEVRIPLFGPNDDLMLWGFVDKLSSDKKTLVEWKYAQDPKMYSRLKMSLQSSSYFFGFPSVTKIIVAVAKKPTLQMHLATPVEDRTYTKPKTKKSKCVECEGTGQTDELIDHPVDYTGDVETTSSPCIPCKGTGKIKTVIEESKLYKNQRERDETPEEFLERVRADIALDPNKYFHFRTFFRDEFDVDGDMNLVRMMYAESERARREGLFLPRYGECDRCEYAAICETHPSGPGCSKEDCSHPVICQKIKEMDK